MSSLPKEFPHEEEPEADVSAHPAEYGPASESHVPVGAEEFDARGAERVLRAVDSGQEIRFPNEAASGL
jgi:hypothetical protein